MAFNGGSNGKARRRQATKKTVRIDLKRRTFDGRRGTADNGIGGCKYCHHRLLSSVVGNVFDGGGAPSSSNHGCRYHSLVVSSSVIVPRLCPDPNGNDIEGNNEDDKDNKDRSRLSEK
jgi:hypothetical protein